VPRDLATIPIETVTFDDVKDLLGTEESFRIEFKESLATTDGRPDRWMGDQSRIGNKARDDIAAQVVAFANAYGGILIVGIEETDDNPKRAKAIANDLIPHVVDCAEQLDRSLRSIIEPPLPMMEVRGVISQGDLGVLLIRIGASSSAPHGYGRPSAAYVRRGSNAEPLTMRDLHSIFFERRTRLERVAAKRTQLKSEGDQIRVAWTDGRLPLPYDHGGAVSAEGPGIYFRSSAVCSDDLSIDNFPDEFFKIPDRLAPSPVVLQHGNLIALPRRANEWQRRYRAVEHAGNARVNRFWKATIEADGTFNGISIMRLTEGTALLHFYAAALLQTMVTSEWIRRWRGRPDVEYTLDADFICHAAPRFHLVDANSNETSPFPWFRASIGPYSIGRRDKFLSTFDSIERELWDLCGVQRREALRLKFDLPAVFSSTGL
jgi:Putative DNA-binding domain